MRSRSQAPTRTLSSYARMQNNAKTTKNKMLLVKEVATQHKNKFIRKCGIVRPLYEQAID